MSAWGDDVPGDLFASQGAAKGSSRAVILAAHLGQEGVQAGPLLQLQSCLLHSGLSWEIQAVKVKLSEKRLPLERDPLPVHRRPHPLLSLDGHFDVCRRKPRPTSV
ncbi:hypothetical protein NDU88_000459 [Pleurodeles waltl]|uniref:Uncharacterized protein n=1 Tax=Pleurodeles waltl TaxID=8319 RepID=A0AAV7V553_PLEWA|nr:hypothetical protein NDU88_000459 [Pleurodeles waltl]